MIREILKANPKTTDGEVVEQLKAKGVEATRSLSSVVRTALKHGKRQTSSKVRNPHGGARKGSGRKPRQAKSERGQGDWSRAMEYLRAHPRSSPSEIVEATGCKKQAAYQARTALKAKRAKRKANRLAKLNGHAGEFVALHAAAALLACCHADVPQAIAAVEAVGQIREAIG